MTQEAEKTTNYSLVYQLTSKGKKIRFVVLPGLSDNVKRDLVSCHCGPVAVV